MTEATYVKLGRDLVAEDGEDPIDFFGEWSPEEPELWEKFTVMLHGREAGEFATAKRSDLVAILVGLGAERQYLCKNHSSLLTGDSGMCEAWEGHLEPWASEGPVNCVEVEVLVWRQETPK